MVYNLIICLKYFPRNIVVKFIRIISIILVNSVIAYQTLLNDRYVNEWITMSKEDSYNSETMRSYMNFYLVLKNEPKFVSDKGKTLIRDIATTKLE